MAPKSTSWEHFWLLVERMTRAIVGARLESGPGAELDLVLATLMRQREQLERAGWFN